MGKSKQLVLTLITILGGLLALQPAHATSEEQVKAALIYKLGLYVKWDYSPSQINYCFVGESTFGISQVLNEKIRLGKLPKTITITNLSELNSIEPQNCQIIYASQDNSKDNRQITKLSETALTISESTDSFQQGVIASIEIRQRRAQLSISQQNLKQSAIQVDSRLLTIVKLFP